MMIGTANSPMWHPRWYGGRRPAAIPRTPPSPHTSAVRGCCAKAWALTSQFSDARRGLFRRRPADRCNDPSVELLGFAQLHHIGLFTPPGARRIVGGPTLGCSRCTFSLRRTAGQSLSFNRLEPCEQVPTHSRPRPLHLDGHGVNSFLFLSRLKQKKQCPDVVAKDIEWQDTCCSMCCAGSYGTRNATRYGCSTRMPARGATRKFQRPHRRRRARWRILAAPSRPKRTRIATRPRSHREPRGAPRSINKRQVPVGENPELAHSTADTLTSTADYVRGHDVSGDYGRLLNAW